MAAAKGKTPAPEFSFASIAPQEVKELPTAVRNVEANPLEQHVINALDKGVQTFPVPDGERAKQAYNFIRSAARDYSLRVRYTTADDKALTPEQAHASTQEVWVYFLVKSEKPARKERKARYTSADIRAWLKDQGRTVPTGKLSKEIRQEFRVAKGFAEAE